MSKIIKPFFVFCILIVVYYSSIGVYKDYSSSIQSAVGVVNRFGDFSKRTMKSFLGINLQSSSLSNSALKAASSSPLCNDFANRYYNDEFLIGLSNCSCGGICRSLREEYFYNIYYSDAKAYFEEGSRFIDKTSYEADVLGLYLYYNPLNASDYEAAVKAVYDEGVAKGYPMDNPLIFNGYEHKYDFVCPYVSEVK